MTTARLVSSGQFDNAVTLALRQAGEDDIMEASLVRVLFVSREPLTLLFLVIVI